MTRRKTFKKQVRARKEKKQETFSTARMHVSNAASSVEEVRKNFWRMAEAMRATRAAWTPGPTADFDSWLALPEVPLDAGSDKPTRQHLVVDLGALEGPAADAIAKGIVRAEELVGGGPDGNILLGRVTVEDAAGERTEYRLPPTLGTWVGGQIGLTRSGHGQFPAYVGFCMPRPGYYGVEFMPGPAPSPEQMARERAAVREWLALKEVEIADTAAPHERGSRYEVLKAGAFFVYRPLIENHDGAEELAQDGVRVRRTALSVPDLTGLVRFDARRVALPTVTVWTLAGAITYRLPPPLATWVLINMDFAARGQKLLPADVEFCRLDGRYTANFVDL
jgi:hypothetical protein